MRSAAPPPAGLPRWSMFSAPWVCNESVSHCTATHSDVSSAAKVGSSQGLQGAREEARASQRVGRAPAPPGLWRKTAGCRAPRRTGSRAQWGRWDESRLWEKRQQGWASKCMQPAQRIHRQNSGAATTLCSALSLRGCSGKPALLHWRALMLLRWRVWLRRLRLPLPRLPCSWVCCRQQASPSELRLHLGCLQPQISIGGFQLQPRRAHGRAHGRDAGVRQADVAASSALLAS
jgi:hypothetical protein